MHEYALMRDIVAAILARLAEESVTDPVAEVILELGILDLHSEAAGRQAFEVLTQGTALEHSRLTIKIRPVLLECPNCRVVTPYQVEGDALVQGFLPSVRCPLCGGWADLTGGQGVGPIEIVLADSEAPV